LPRHAAALAIGVAAFYICETMLDAMYNKRILELAANIGRIGRLERPDASAVAHSRLCGSKVTVDLCVQDGRVTDFAHDVKACALGQASSAIMARHVVGSTIEELRALRDTARRMLKEGGEPPGGKWSEVEVLLPVRDYKARHASTLLTFDAVVDALSRLDAADGAEKPAASASALAQH
jgi:NifU-like protein involved in Fe-S cluster formation